MPVSFRPSLVARPGIDLNKTGIPKAEDLQGRGVIGDFDFVRKEGTDLMREWLDALESDVAWQQLRRYRAETHTPHVSGIPRYLEPGQSPGGRGRFYAKFNPGSPEDFRTEDHEKDRRGVIHATSTFSTRVLPGHIGISPIRFIKNRITIPDEAFSDSRGNWECVNEWIYRTDQPRVIAPFPDGQIALFNGDTLHTYTPTRPNGKGGQFLMMTASLYPNEAGPVSPNIFERQ